MFVRLLLIACLIGALAGSAGAVAASENARACPEDGNPSRGLQTSVASSDGASLNAADGVNRAFERVGCSTRIE